MRGKALTAGSTDRSTDRAAAGADAGSQLALIVAAGSRTCAIPARCVSEVMRPLPIQAIAGAPIYLPGLSVIRGAPVPVVDLNLLLRADRGEHVARRFVVLDVAERRVALAVDCVHGLRDLDLDRFDALPPLLRDAAVDTVEAIGVADAQLLVVLRAACLVPDDVWAKLATGREVP